MATPNTQFSVGTHILASIAAFAPQPMKSEWLATSVNTNPVQVRKVLSKLVKAGLVHTTRGRDGACELGRAASKITLLDIYRATENHKVFNMHGYPVCPECTVSREMEATMQGILAKCQQAFEQSLASYTIAKITENFKCTTQPPFTKKPKR